MIDPHDIEAAASALADHDDPGKAWYLRGVWDGLCGLPRDEDSADPEANACASCYRAGWLAARKDWSIVT